MILIAMIGAGCLVGAIDFLIEGVTPGIVLPPFAGILAFAVMLAVGLVLIGAESARSGRPTTADLAGVRRTRGRQEIRRSTDGGCRFAWSCSWRSARRVFALTWPRRTGPGNTNRRSRKIARGLTSSAHSRSSSTRRPVHRRAAARSAAEGGRAS